ncbi:MAG: metal ABC transporter permease, partial [Candidatus Marinimicrobia bacterium]|nr:metal ABC transporter permease [Candidatus Neomarinimicrobiota bacterium]MDP6610812.1 metal ABC transporter permease [Candidatus Neomarinimicrobiota bacterium]
LFVTPEKIAYTALLYTAIGFFHWKYKQQFFEISHSHLKTTELNSSDRFWDFLFYVTFGFVVTSSVKIAGVLLVFSFLIIPTIAALLFKKSVKGRLVFGWCFGIIGSLLGMSISIIADVPTGAAIVVSFGSMLGLMGIYKSLR